MTLFLEHMIRLLDEVDDFACAAVHNLRRSLGRMPRERRRYPRLSALGTEISSASRARHSRIRRLQEA